VQAGYEEGGWYDEDQTQYDIGIRSVFYRIVYAVFRILIHFLRIGIRIQIQDI